MAMHNVPHAAAPFVNRVREIAEIIHRLNSIDCRLLTLVGPGGMGKTRLAIRAAENCGDEFVYDSSKLDAQNRTTAIARPTA